MTPTAYMHACGVSESVSSEKWDHHRASHLDRWVHHECAVAYGVRMLVCHLGSTTLDCLHVYHRPRRHSIPMVPVRRYLRWVRNDGDFADCETDDDCRGITGEGIGEDLKCGALFGQNALNGGVTEEVRGE